MAVNFESYENGQPTPHVPKHGMQFKVDPEHEFAYELSCIKDIRFRSLVVRALHKIPDYFWFIPASSSGKYHPNFSLGMGGLVRHVKGVFRVAEELFRNPLLAPFTDLAQDRIRVAILLHDGLKQGAEPHGTHTVHEHPVIVRENLMPEGLDEAECFEWHYICNLIDSHMGKWNVDTKGVSTVVLPIPSTEEEMFVHLCDYLGSRKGIEIDVAYRQPQLGYEAPPDQPPAWHEELANEKQINYIVILFDRCNKEKVENPHREVTIINDDSQLVLTKKQASDIITDLKAKLGIN